MSKNLYTKDSVLNKKELEEYLAKFASDNIISKTSEKNTYPIPRVRDNCKYISLVYTLLNEHIKIGIPIHPAGEWILDNYYMIEKSAKTIEKDLNLRKYISFPGISQSGFARIFVLTNEIISNTDGKISQNDLKDYLIAYQTQKDLTMDEIWSIPLFLQINLIEKIRHVCERIFISQMEKYKVDNMLQRIIENKPEKEIKMSAKGAYPFIEYMSYKLKRYGKEGLPYLQAFEEQVNKMGMKISEVINREHFDIAVRKLSIKNAIISLRDISRMNMVSIFKEINVVEQILNNDPAGVYAKMEYASKDYYRTKILEISKKTKISEIFIAEEVLRLCNKNELEQENLLDDRYTEKTNQIRKQKKSHVGYYLIDEGKEELLSKLLNKKVRSISSDAKSKIYVSTIYFLTILFTLILSKWLKFSAILLFIPLQNTVTQILQYILSKSVKQRHIPKIDLQNSLKKEQATMCVIPVSLKSKEDVKEMFNKMEVYYIANKSENLFFTLLGDCTSSNKQRESYDKEIVQEGLYQSKRLNEKYGEIFFFTYRNREWSEVERCYMGWERKRGMISQFNEFLMTGKSSFTTNNCKIENLPKIKYVITIDSDTNLVMDSVFKLVGAMSHILNFPEVDKIKNLVFKGYGIIQPRVNLDIDDGRKTLFTRLFAGNSGTDLYSSAVSDVYQDTFGEGIFTGKGIYDLETFYDVLKDSIPENKVLSHDLLEGNFLRCGLANDIYLMDGYPSSYNAYKIRKHRWIRGDIQILGWMKSSLNFLSKYKILDNIVRNLNEVFIFINLLLGMVLKNPFMILISLLLLATPMVIKLVDLFINKKSGEFNNKLFVPTFTEIQRAIYRYILDIVLLPDIANLETNAFAKAIYRMRISHLYLLEWTTANEAESKSKLSIQEYYLSMIFTTIVGLFTMPYPFSFLWIFAPLIMYLMSRKEKEVTSKISKENIKYLLEIGKKTWNYFKENMTNYLVNDNYQENRRNEVAKRTSSTNIGLEILAIIASYDLKYETKEYVLELLENVIETIISLPKWNGHLYNWYDTEKLTPLTPIIVSAVDSGNYVGYLYVLKQFLLEQVELEKESVRKNSTTKKDKITERIESLIQKVDNLINDTDFSKLYDENIGLFSIGFNVEENRLIDSYYDLLASESRQTTLVAIAKKDIPSKSWGMLGRTLTNLRGHVGLVSWGGTAFEYLMPNLIIPTYDSTLIDESCKLLILSQKEYASKLGIPWGISESSFSLKDFQGNYQYKTFGVPWLGLKRGLSQEVVVSPYASFLALTENQKDVINNLKRLEKEGTVGKYGFFDSIDYTQNKEIIKIFMAHHQGMILAAINNGLKNNIFQKRFMRNPEMEGIKVLLQETVPNNIILTKEKKEKAQKIKYKIYDEYSQRTTGVNAISTNNYTAINYQNGLETSKLNDIALTEENNVYIKDIDSKKVWSLANNKHDTIFTAFDSKFKIENGNLKAQIKNTIAPDLQVEVKEIKLTNKGLNDLNLEITTSGKPILVNQKQYNAHPAFENMFLNFSNINDKIIITRNRRNQNEQIPYYVTTLFAEEGNMEFEIDKEKFISRKNNRIPDSISKSWPFSNKVGTVINPIIALRRIVNIKPNETKKLYLIVSADYDKDQAIKNLEEYEDIRNLDRIFELSKVQTEAETRYLGIKGSNISTYQKMLKFLIVPKGICGDIKNLSLNMDIDLSNERIWKYGVSGDFPIILVNIKDLNDYFVVDEVLKAYEYFISKNIKTEVVITTKVDIEENIRNSNMSRYLNQREGIFILNNLTREEKRVFELRASIVIDAENGLLEKQIKELDDSIETDIYLEDSILNKLENETSNNMDKLETGIGEESNTFDKLETGISAESNGFDNLQDIIKIKDLKLFNGYGGFNKDGSEYWIIQNKENVLPVAWSNVLANKNFGSIVTDSMGGFIWYKNSRTNRVTCFYNDSYMDEPQEKFILSLYNYDKKSKTAKKKKSLKKSWNLTFNDNNTNNEYVTCFGMGYAKYFLNNEIYQECTQYVPAKDSCKVSIIKLKNNLDEKISIKIKYELDFQLGENIEDKRFIVKVFKEGLNMNLIKNLKNPSNFAYVTSSEKINETNEIEIELEENEEKEVVFVLGCEESDMESLDKATKYITNYEEEFENTKKYWKEKTSKVKSSTPEKSFDFLQNNWLVYQSIASRMFSRAGFYQASGGYGFRDQLQDSLGLKYVDINILKNQILMCCKHQFFEGDVEHWWHEDSKLGVRTRYSDDLLWLPYAVLEYIDFTGDYSILNEEEMYLKAEELTDLEEDRVGIYDLYENKGTVFEHCTKAIERSMKFGENGLPLIKSGDWNDGMNRVGQNEIGESVWLGFFLYDILTRFIPLIDYESKFLKQQGVSKEVAIAINDNSEKQEAKVEFIQDVNTINYDEIKEKFENCVNSLKKSLNTNGWDGRWYKRAIDDNGMDIGSIKLDECKIDSIAQSWSVISNAGDNDKKHIALESAENYLIDNENNLIKLLTPALEKRDLGYITAYAKGLRENGGQYTHAAIWLLIAEAMLEYNEKAFDIYKKINPIKHSLNKETVDKYKVEPYVVEADICSEGALAGRGGWTWYTGSSSLLYKAQIEYILGIKINQGVLTINPCVPESWKKFEVKLKYFDAEYTIKYIKGNKKVMLINEKEANEIKLQKKGKYIISKYF